MTISNLNELINLVKKREKKRIVVAYGQEKYTILALQKAVAENLADVTLVGDENTIKQIFSENDIKPNGFHIVHEADEMEAGRRAVALIKQKEGDVLMKGLISTDKYLKCILDKEKGLMKPNAVLTHISLIECPNYHKLMVATDCAFIPQPDLKQKIAMTNYVIETARKLGIEQPKVALVSFTEKINAKVPSCTDAALITRMAERGQIKNALVDGPLALDVAVDPESVKIKGLKSCVEGDADALVFPNLETGNVFYKTMTKLLRSEIASYVAGTQVPSILPSRGDSDKSKFYSILLACLMAAEIS
jgi:phosphate butyryltransferase